MTNGFAREEANTTVAPAILSDSNVSSVQFGQKSIKSNCSNTNTEWYSGSNWVPYFYDQLYSGIHAMMEFSENDDFYLDRAVGKRALKILNIIRSNFEGNPPKILNQDGEALAFTWVLDTAKQFLIVSEDQIDIIYLSEQYQDVKEETLPENDELAYDRLLSILPMNQRSTSGYYETNAT